MQRGETAMIVMKYFFLQIRKTVKIIERGIVYLGEKFIN